MLFRPLCRRPSSQSAVLSTAGRGQVVPSGRTAHFGKAVWVVLEKQRN